MSVAADERGRWVRNVATRHQLAAPMASSDLLRRSLDGLPLDDPERSAYLQQLVTVEVFAGRLRGAESLALDALGDDRVAEPARTGITFGLGQSLLLQGRLHEAAELFDAVGAAIPPTGAPSVLVDAAMASMLGGDLAAAVCAGEQALLAARAVGDVVAEVAALAVLCSGLGLAGDIDVALACGRAAVARADHGGTDEAHRNMPHLFLAPALLWADQVEECRESLRRAEEIGRRFELDWHDPIRLATEADLQYRLGAWDAAMVCVHAGLSRSLDGGCRLGDVWLHSVLARIHLDRGQADVAIEETERAERAAAAGRPGGERVTALRALHAEATGDLERAAHLVKTLWREQEQRGVAIKQLELCCDAARIALRHGDLAFADEIVATTAELARRCPETCGPANLARCRGLRESDAALLERAATMLRVRRRPLEGAFAAWEAATLFAERGDHARADGLFADARCTLDPIGARPQPIAGTVTAPTPDWTLLTAAERTIVAMVADGLSNRAIAERLICSRRTVDSHLHHVYCKLGIDSRVALVLAAQRAQPATR
jgi:DNA-binding CsgD family transcriptional regulator/tetratricopeptide (TPR) repeat protein